MTRGNGRAPAGQILGTTVLWPIVRLGHIGRFTASGIDKVTIETELPVKMVNYTDVYGNVGAQIDHRATFMETTAPREKAVEHALRPGDVLFTPSSETADDIGWAAVVTEPLEGVVYSYHLTRWRPAIELDVGFARYALNSRLVRAQLTRVAKGTTRQILTRDDFRSLRISLPSIGAQRAVAAYLNAETDRIDGMVSARAQQLALMAEGFQVEAATLLHAARAPLVALRRIVDLLPGFSYRSEDFLTDPGHARLLRGINVDVGTLRWYDTVWVNDTLASTTSRFALAAGDIVMGMDRPVISSGVRIARVAEDDLPACLVQRVARLRARSGLSQDYLYAALRGPGLAGHFAPVFTGVSVPHVSPSQILSYEIPLPPASQQGEIVRGLVTMEEQARGYQAAADRQIELLLERRQALITAAVTGQLEIPGVAA